jgi:hypothetical protein
MIDHGQPLAARRSGSAVMLLHSIVSVASQPRIQWDRKMFLALFSLVCIWGVLFYLTWAHWGDLTIDSGREMYVAAELVGGKTLYSDVWYLYFPAGPYLNSELFRLFGVQLSVLYWAGALAALGSAIFLFLTGLELVPLIAAWTTGTILLIQSFAPGLFCFPLPYSFGAVYGCFCACLCLWFAVKACSTARAWWTFGAGMAASVALLMKQEIGAGCFAGLAILLFVRGVKQRSVKSVAFDLLALLPGLLLCVAVIYWMFSLRGAEFLTQENLATWPTSYFMRTYGSLWLSTKGLTLAPSAFLMRAIGPLLIVAVFWLGFRRILGRYGERPWLFFAGILGLTALVVISAYSELMAKAARWLFFPPAAPFLVLLWIPLASWLFWRYGFASGYAQIVMLFCLATCISLRILLRMEPFRYAIYYDGPVILSYFLVLSLFLSRNVPGPKPGYRRVELFPYVAALGAVVAAVVPLYRSNVGSTPLITKRGVIYATPQKVRAYRAVLDFIQSHQQADASFLSVPEDMSLYFFANIECPTRVYQFGPGIIAPGKMTGEFIQEIERKKVEYLIWSNRTFEEYGTPNYGVDFDQAEARYFKESYRPIRTIGGESSGDWKAVIWQRRMGPQSGPGAGSAPSNGDAGAR